MPYIIRTTLANRKTGVPLTLYHGRSGYPSFPWTSKKCWATEFDTPADADARITELEEESKNSDIHGCATSAKIIDAGRNQ